MTEMIRHVAHAMGHAPFQGYPLWVFLADTHHNLLILKNITPAPACVMES